MRQILPDGIMDVVADPLDSLLSVEEPDREGVKWVTVQLSAAVSNASVHFEDQVAGATR
jgi:hypothetical protein